MQTAGIVLVCMLNKCVVLHTVDDQATACSSDVLVLV